MYDYQAARAGKGAAAPPPPSTGDFDDFLPLPSSSSAPGGGGGASGGAIAAYKKENEKLKELLQLREDGGSSDVLEGKYLAQLKQNRTLTVQLEAEKDKAKALQGRVAALESAAAAAAADAATNKAKGKCAAAAATPNPRRDIFAAEDEAGSEGGGAAEELAAVRQQLTRAQQQGRERDVALEEQKREVARLKECLTREVGAAEVSKVLSSTTTTTGSGNSWKGRAEQLSLLKTKVKELEKSLAESEGANAQMREQFELLLQQQQEAGSSSAGGDDLESLMALVRRTENHSHGGAASTGTTTTTNNNSSNAKRDVDDEAKDHLSQLQMKKKMAQHDLERQLEAAKRDIQSERKKQTALQARFQILQDSNTQLKENLTLLIDKSQSDDELVELYKQELADAKASLASATEEVTSLREEVWGADNHSTASHHHNNTNTRGGGGGGGGSAPPSLAGGAATRRRSSALTAAGGAKPNAYTHQMMLLSQVEDAPVRELSEWVYQTLLQQKQEGAAAMTATSVNPYIVPLLQTAHTYVVETNRENKQLFFASTSLYDMYNRLIQSALNYIQQQQQQPKPSTAGNHKANSTANSLNTNAIMALVSQIVELPPIENYLLSENSSLKKRVQSLTELMEREQRAYTTLAQQSSMAAAAATAAAAAAANSNNNNTIHNSNNNNKEGEEDDYVTKYNELHKQYVELRKAFNQMKQREMKGQQ